MRLSTLDGARLTVCCTALVLQACAPLSLDQTRAGTSSLGCMQAAITRHPPAIPLAELPDHQAHCIAAGLIALHCSTSEAWLASVGKELSDLVTPQENAEWRDLKSDHRGIRCARSATSDSSVVDCCTN